MSGFMALEHDIKAAMKAKVREIIDQVDATAVKNMGKVMDATNKALAGQSDGRTISSAVKELLS